MNHRKKISKIVISFFTGILLACISLILVFEILFWNRFYPAIDVAGVNITRLTFNQADQKIKDTIYQRRSVPIKLGYKNESYLIKLNDVSVQTEPVLNEAYQFGRSRLYSIPLSFQLNIDFYPSLDKQIEAISKNISQAPIDSQLLVNDDQITAIPSQEGVRLDDKELKNMLVIYLNTGKVVSKLPTKKVSPKFNYSSALVIKKVLDRIKLKPLKLTYQNQNWIIDLKTLLNLIDLADGQQINLISVKIGKNKYPDIRLKFDEKKLDAFLKGVAYGINQDVKEPLFSFNEERITQFQPPQEGKKLDLEKTADLLKADLTEEDNFSEINLPVEIIKPKNILTNRLGIKELIGRGISNFSGSIPNRIYNISLTASKLNGELIAPGEIFSFNNTVGDISSASGFKQAYVIKSGRTVLDDGGGVCQDSTTLFRAVLNAGLPVVERTAHAYRVGYYEQGFPPGLDATIFTPSVDFKFKNDTPAHILIQAYVSRNNLYIDLYGTSDGRVSQISTPIVTNSTPPPPPLYQDDPTLPKGETKQIDWPAHGANVIFKRTVTRDGETLINETFRSNYHPWQAVYLVGTK